MREEEETPTTDQGCVYVILGIKEPLVLPPKKLM
jgi:hypothetical protein